MSVCVCVRVYSVYKWSRADCAMVILCIISNYINFKFKITFWFIWKSFAPHTRTHMNASQHYTILHNIRKRMNAKTKLYSVWRGGSHEKKKHFDTWYIHSAHSEICEKPSTIAKLQCQTLDTHGIAIVYTHIEFCLHIYRW